MANWFLIDTDFGDWIVDLDEVIFMSVGYHYDEGWADEEQCHIYPITLYMKNCQEYKVLLNRRGYRALIKELNIETGDKEKE